MFRKIDVQNPGRAAALALAAAAMLAGCGLRYDGAAESETAPSGPDASPDSAADAADRLAGTRWQLVEFQSMDDAVGTTRPEDPTLYVMELKDDGTAAMQLNCNRASGNWSAQPGSDGTSGTFEFGPLAMTRALCAPPSMDEQIAAQSEYVRGYLLRDERLYLSLMADAGIYVWERIE